MQRAANRTLRLAATACGLNSVGNTGSLGVATNRGTNPSALHRVNINHYFADAARKLVRRAYGVWQSGLIDSIVAEHLKTLQFRYILKPAPSGTIFEQPVEQIKLADSRAVGRTVKPGSTNRLSATDIRADSNSQSDAKTGKKRRIGNR